MAIARIINNAKIEIMIDKKILRSKVPHGSFKEIAKRAGVTPKSVSEFFSGKTVHSEKIEMATLELLAEMSEKKTLLLGKII